MSQHPTEASGDFAANFEWRPINRNLLTKYARCKVRDRQRQSKTLFMVQGALWCAVVRISQTTFFI
jgi:hypothetical protein